jgi:hypothetical protein
MNETRRNLLTICAAVAAGAALEGCTRQQTQYISSTTERYRLPSNTTFYVAFTGSDTTGDGSAGNPWLTIQHAIDTISLNIDGGGHGIEISVGSGVFAGVGVKVCVGVGYLYFNGAGTANTTITDGPADGVFNSFGECIGINVVDLPAVYASNVTFNSSQGCAVQVLAPGAFVSLNNLTTSATGDVAFITSATSNAFIQLQSPGVVFYDALTVTIKVGAANQSLGYLLAQDCSLANCFATKYTLVGIPHWGDAFYMADNSASILAFVTVSGKATGPRFHCTKYATLDTFSHLAANLPGSTPGITSQGGQLIQFSGSSVACDGAMQDSILSYQAPINAATITLGDFGSHLIVDPAEALASLSITMNPNPGHGQLWEMYFSQAITALTISPNAGQNLIAAPTTVVAGKLVKAIYNLINTTWYFGA